MKRLWRKLCCKLGMHVCKEERYTTTRTLVQLYHLIGIRIPVTHYNTYLVLACKHCSYENVYWLPSPAAKPQPQCSWNATGLRCHGRKQFVLTKGAK